MEEIVLLHRYLTWVCHTGADVYHANRVVTLIILRHTSCDLLSRCGIYSTINVKALPNFNLNPKTSKKQLETKRALLHHSLISENSKICDMNFRFSIQLIVWKLH